MIYTMNFKCHFYKVKILRDTTFCVRHFIYIYGLKGLMNSTKNIITNIKGGDKDAFKVFFDDFYPILCAFAKKFLRSTDQSEDAAQEALVKYWQKREEFNNLQGVKSFLYVIVRNDCINILKRSKKSVDVEALKELETESFLKDNIINQETFMKVRQAVESLPTRQREIIKLTLEGVKNPEIATLLGITEQTVKTTKRNAFQKLRDLLKDNYYLLLVI